MTDERGRSSDEWRAPARWLGSGDSMDDDGERRKEGARGWRARAGEGMLRGRGFYRGEVGRGEGGRPWLQGAFNGIHEA